MAKAKKTAKKAAKVLVDVNDPRYILQQLEKEFDSVPSDSTLNTALQEIARDQEKEKVEKVKKGFKWANEQIEAAVKILRIRRKAVRDLKEALVKLNDLRAKFLVDGDFDKLRDDVGKVCQKFARW